MESIIVMILLGIASTVFQSVIKNKNEKNEKAKKVEFAYPKAQPMVKVANKINTAGDGISKKKITIPSQKLEKESSNMSKESGTLNEGVQTEALEDIEIPEQKSEPAITEYPGLLHDITIDELQRSIIMAEVLGKPKALRRISR